MYLEQRDEAERRQQISTAARPLNTALRCRHCLENVNDVQRVSRLKIIL